MKQLDELIKQALTAHQAGEFELAMQLYQQILSQQPEHAQVLNNLAGLYSKQGKLLQALKAYRDALHQAPDYLEAHYNLGLLLLRLEEWDAALKQFQNVITINPKNHHAHAKIGHLYLQQEQLEQAKQHYLQALALQPQELEVLNNLGAIAIKQHHAQQAIEYFTQVLALDNDHLDARSNIAALFLHHDRYENALRHYRVLLKARPDDLEANYNAGVANLALGKLDLALDHFNKVVTVHPENVNALSNIGAVYMRQEKPEQAIEVFKQVIALAPDNATVKHMLSALTGKDQSDHAPVDYIANLFDHYALYYDNHLRKALHYQVPELLAAALQTVTGLSEANWLVCDLGCGTGLSGQTLKPYAKQLIGVDLSDKMLAIAKHKNCYHKLKLSDINTYLDQQENTFDLIIAGDVLGYIGELTTTFYNCQRALMSSGYFIFSTESTTGTDFILQANGRYAHANKYIQRLAAQHGFIVASSQTAILRQHNGEPVPGQIWVLQKVS